MINPVKTNVAVVPLIFFVASGRAREEPPSAVEVFQEVEPLDKVAVSVHDGAVDVFHGVVPVEGVVVFVQSGAVDDVGVTFQFVVPVESVLVVVHNVDPFEGVAVFVQSGAFDPEYQSVVPVERVDEEDHGEEPVDNVAVSVQAGADEPVFQSVVPNDVDAIVSGTEIVCKSKIKRVLRIPNFFNI